MTVEPPKLIWKPISSARASGSSRWRWLSPSIGTPAAEARRLDAWQSVWNTGEHEDGPEERTPLGDDRHYEHRPVC
jgi:hypothetical protein